MKPDRWKRIEKIYQQAKQREASARPAFLDEACAGDAELRRQVESLLKADNDAESFLDTPAMNLAAQMMGDEQTPSLVGKRISRYEIVEQIGAGGMGEVYRAKDIRLNRQVAIKVLPAHMSNNAEAMARFEREARAVAALSHSNILAIHDFGNEDGVCYAVTELLEGETLRDRLQRSALAWREAAKIGIAVSDGLSAAHAKGIIHRDLKPENIFLLKGSEAKILDFGLARVQVASINSVNTTAVAEPCMTEPGRVLGTFGYMSPEQVRGEKADARSDVFSLGCVLYEMVARRRAFEGETPAEKMAAILRDEPQWLRHLGKKAPQELERVITRCLNKKADERYQSAGDLAADLRGMVSAAEVSLPARPIKSVYTTIWIAAALLVLSAIALTYWRTRGSQPAEHAIDSIAVLPLVNASGDEGLDYLSDGITESLINSLSQLPQLHVVARPIVFRYKGKETDPMKVGGELTVRAVLTGKMILRGETLSIQADLIDATNGAELWGDRYDRRITDILAVQNEIARRISEKLRLQLTGEEQQRLAKRYTESVEAYKLYLTGRFHENKLTEEGIKKGIDYFHQALDKDPNYALAYVGLSDSYGQLGQINMPPKQACPQARTYAEKALALDETLADAHMALAAHNLFYTWDLTAAEHEIDRALELNPNMAFAHDLHGHLLSAQGHFSEAIVESRQATEIEPLFHFHQSNLGYIYYNAGKNDQVLEQCEKALELEPNNIWPRLFIGWAYGQLGRYEKAIAELIKTRDLPSGFAPATSELGYVYAISGRQAEAQEMARQLQKRAAREFIDPFYIAIVYLGLGDYEQTFDWLNKAIDERSSYMAWLNVEPKFKALRSDPRFKALVRRVGLAP